MDSKPEIIKPIFVCNGECGKCISKKCLDY